MLGNEPLLEAIVDSASSGDNVIVTGVAGRVIEVYRLFFVCDVAMLVTVKDGVATALTGAMSMQASGAIVLDAYDAGIPVPWFTTSPGNAFIINTTGGVGIRGRCYYTSRTP